jgi:hypothetical protein
MKHCTYCGKEYPDEAEACQIDGEPLQLVEVHIPETQPQKVKRALNKNLSGYIWPWLEPVLGVLFVFEGVKTIIKHEYHDHLFVYHGVVADFAGVLMLLGAFLLFRGLAWRKRGWVNWTVLDKVVGAVVGVGILYFIVMRFVSIL